MAEDWYDEARSVSKAIGEPMCVDFDIALMPMDKGRPGVALFFNPGRDWSHQHLTKHGRKYLATAKATPGAARYRDMSVRATSLKYGLTRADKGAEGLREDLQRLGYDEATINIFLKAAEPCWKRKDKP